MKEFKLTEIDERFPESIRPLLNEIKRLQDEKVSLVQKQRYEEAARIRIKEKELWRELLENHSHFNPVKSNIGL